MTSTINFSTSYGNKGTGANQSNTLTAKEWNGLMSDLNTMVGEIPTSSGSSVVSTEIDPLDANKTFVKVGDVTVAELTSKGDKGTNVGLSGNNNINIEPRPAAGTGEGKNTPGLADRKGGNIALKPGDDIEFWAHKRGTKKNDEVSVKIMTEVPKASDPTKIDEVAAKLQLNAGDIVLTSKDKVEKSDVMNITVNKATDTRGYLKVRAQAIDLRCETHGGIALQPKGEDSDHHMNKIKFEHGGGDGLEFGTFNTEHTSLFTGDYRFNKNGTIKLATRTTVASDKADPSDSTTAYKYVKAADDFYDNISAGDPTCTWEDVVNTANHITTYKLDDQNNTIDGGVLKVKGINNSTTNTLTITTANPSNGTVQDYVIPAAEQVISANTYTPQTIASCSINDIIMFVNWAKGTGYGPWSSQAIANKEELQWRSNGFAAVTPVTPGENPVGE